MSAIINMRAIPQRAKRSKPNDWILMTLLKPNKLATEDKKSPQIVGLGPPMWSPIFYEGNFNVNPLEILVHLQLLGLHDAYQSKVVPYLLPFET